MLHTQKKKTHNETKQCRPQTLQLNPAAAHTFVITLPFTFTLTPLWHNTFGWSLNSQHQSACLSVGWLCAGKQKKKCNNSPEENSFNDLPCIRRLLLLLLLLRVLCISSCLHSLAICCCSSPIAAHLK